MRSRQPGCRGVHAGRLSPDFVDGGQSVEQNLPNNDGGLARIVGCGIAQWRNWLILVIPPRFADLPFDTNLRQKRCLVLP